MAKRSRINSFVLGGQSSTIPNTICMFCSKIRCISWSMAGLRSKARKFGYSTCSLAFSRFMISYHHLVTSFSSQQNQKTHQQNHPIFWTLDGQLSKASTNHITLPLTAALLALASPAFAQGTPGELIRCPDWESLVNVARFATPAEKAQKKPFRDLIGKTTQSTSAVNQSKAVSDGADQSARAAGFSSAVRASSCPTYLVRSGDTLGAIAARHLGNSARFPDLIRANSTKVTSAKTLQVGTRLSIPCDTATAPLIQTASVKQVSSRSAPNAPRATPSSVVEVALPLWTAKPGERFDAVLKRWAATAGYQVVTDSRDAWTLSVPVRIEANFKDALNQLIAGLGVNGSPPLVRIYPNKVVRLGGAS